jgi:hypothetical protein
VRALGIVGAVVTHIRPALIIGHDEDDVGFLRGVTRQRDSEACQQGNQTALLHLSTLSFMGNSGLSPAYAPATPSTL